MLSDNTLKDETVRDPGQVQVTTDMIASNVPAWRRVAPALAEMSIIDDMYEFAALLRAGSIRPAESKG
jgi:hypothetical protein